MLNILGRRSHIFGSLSITRSMASSSEAREIEIPVPWGHISGKVWGPDLGKPVLAVHGWQDNAGTFDKLAPLLPANWRIVAIDLAGHGRSSHLPTGDGYYQIGFAIQIRRVIDYLGWKKLYYLGHSMGAGLGFLFMGLFPGLIERMVSIDMVKLITAKPELYPNSVTRGIEQLFKIESDKQLPPAYTVEAAVKRLMDNVSGSLTKESAEILLRRGSRPATTAELQAAAGSGGPMIVYSRDRFLQIHSITPIFLDQMRILAEKITGNVLIIKAQDAPLYETKELYDEFIEIYKRRCYKFKYVEVEGTHHVHLNNPEKVISYITEFLGSDDTTSNI